MSNTHNQYQFGRSKSPLKQALLFFVGGLLLGGTFTAGVFMNRAKHKAVSTSEILGENLFKVDGVVYTNATLPRAVQMNYYSLSNSIYDAEKNFLNQIALRIALAKDNKIDLSKTDDLPTLETLLNIQNVTDADVDAYYKSILSQYGAAVFGGQTYEQIKPQLKMQMMRQKTEQTVSAKIQEFTDNGRISTFLVQPEAPSVKLDLTGYPSRGNQTSTVTFVEVADYMCPHCRETEPMVEKLYKEFGDKVKFVHVSFPLNPEGLNGALARGAYCATQQGQDQFWKYHEHAFQVPWDKMNPKNTASAEKFFNDEAVTVATQANLDIKAFETCLVSEDAKKYVNRLKTDFNANTGFKGTPTFYLNDKLIQINPTQFEETLRNALNQVAPK